MTPARSRTIKFSRAALDRALDGFDRSLREKRPETRGTYQRALREFARWFAADGRVRFEVADIMRYKRYLTYRRKFAPVSVSTYLTAVRRFCEYLVRRRLLAENPARHVGGNERPRAHSRDVLRPEEVERLLAAVDRSDERGRRDYAIIMLMLGCGLSEIEVVRADVRDLVASEGSATMAVQGKGRLTKDASVAIPADVRAALESYLSTRRSSAPESPLFASAGNRTRGARMTTRGVRDRVNGLLEKAGIRVVGPRRITPYSLRHTSAMQMARQGATADEIRDRMRLGTLSTALLYLDSIQPDH